MSYCIRPIWANYKTPDENLSNRKREEKQAHRVLQQQQQQQQQQHQHHNIIESQQLQHHTSHTHIYTYNNTPVAFGVWCCLRTFA